MSSKQKQSNTKQSQLQLENSTQQPLAELDDMEEMARMLFSVSPNSPEGKEIIKLAEEIDTALNS